MFHPGERITVPFRQGVSSTVVLREEADRERPVSMVMLERAKGEMLRLENGSG